jgi:hypothetical protein
MPGLRPGAYNAFVSVQDDVHGMQWVGLVKGTGAQATARLILLSDGATVTIPGIKLDKAGTVTGIIRDQATRNPIDQAFAAVASFNTGRGDPGPGAVTTRRADNYQWLGPCQ